jgi:hypothetical protein
MAAFLSSSSDAVRVLQAASTRKIKTVVAKNIPTRRCILVSPRRHTKFSARSVRTFPTAFVFALPPPVTVRRPSLRLGTRQRTDTGSGKIAPCTHISDNATIRACTASFKDKAIRLATVAAPPCAPTRQTVGQNVWGRMRNQFSSPVDLDRVPETRCLAT